MKHNTRLFLFALPLISYSTQVFSQSEVHSVQELTKKVYALDQLVRKIFSTTNDTPLKTINGELLILHAEILQLISQIDNNELKETLTHFVSQFKKIIDILNKYTNVGPIKSISLAKEIEGACDVPKLFAQATKELDAIQKKLMTNVSTSALGLEVKKLLNMLIHITRYWDKFEGKKGVLLDGLGHLLSLNN